MAAIAASWAARPSCCCDGSDQTLSFPPTKTSPWLIVDARVKRDGLCDEQGSQRGHHENVESDFPYGRPTPGCKALLILTGCLCHPLLLVVLLRHHAVNVRPVTISDYPQVSNTHVRYFPIPAVMEVTAWTEGKRDAKAVDASPKNRGFDAWNMVST